MANFILPYEPEYTAHRTDEQKHIETKKWLSHRIDELEHSPSIVPERPQFSSWIKCARNGTAAAGAKARKCHGANHADHSFLAWSGF